MIKRAFDVFVAGLGLLFSAPILFAAMLAVWLQDRHSPFYIAPRIGVGGRPFRMVKLRSMVIDADKTGVDSTAAGDPRVTRVGTMIRRFKLDELTQLWNVLVGDMSMVGPRPNVARETDLYSPLERGLLTVRPGITDFASIVFSDEADILAEFDDPDVAYNQLIRPGKSALGLFYIQNRTLVLDARICAWTALSLFSRSAALDRLQRCLEELDAPRDLVRLSGRKDPLRPTAPPGSDSIVTSRTS